MKAKKEILKVINSASCEDADRMKLNNLLVEIVKLCAEEGFVFSSFYEEKIGSYYKIRPINSEIGKIRAAVRKIKLLEEALKELEGQQNTTDQTPKQEGEAVE